MNSPIAKKDYIQTFQVVESMDKLTVQCDDAGFPRNVLYWEKVIPCCWSHDSLCNLCASCHIVTANWGEIPIRYSLNSDRLNSILQPLSQTPDGLRRWSCRGLTYRIVHSYTGNAPGAIVNAPGYYIDSQPAMGHRTIIKDSLQDSMLCLGQKHNLAKSYKLPEESLIVNSSIISQ